jgi:hypothetical protein
MSALMSVVVRVYSSLVLGAALLACQPEQQPTTRAPANKPVPPDSVATPPAPRPTEAAPVLEAPVDSAYAYRIRPVDETRHNPALRTFVQRVLGYARQRQWQQLLAVADDSIVISYGGGIFGKEEFRAYLANPEWDAYGQIARNLAQGGARDTSDEGGPVYVFPYFHASRLLPALPEAEQDGDPYHLYFGLSKHLKLYQKPGTSGPVVVELAYPMLVWDEENDRKHPSKHWLSMRTIGGRYHGWVVDKEVDSQASMTLVIAERAGRYLITSVAPYD